MEALSSPSDILNARNEVGATGPYQVVSFGHVPRCILDVNPDRYRTTIFCRRPFSWSGFD